MCEWSLWVFREEGSATMMFDEMPHSNGEEGGGAALGYGFEVFCCHDQVILLVFHVSSIGC